MSKKFNVDEIVKARKNELDASPLFQARQHTQQVPQPETSNDNKAKEVIITGNSQTARLDTNVKRPIRRRYSVDIFEDQYDDLRELSHKMQMNGKECSISQMVREALDNYLPNKKKDIK